MADTPTVRTVQTSVPGMSILPLKLCDYIPSLGQTFLAGVQLDMQWLPACQYHLFIKIVLAPPDVLAFLEYVNSSSSSIATTCPLQRLVCSTLRTFWIKRIITQPVDIQGEISEDC